MMLGNTGGFAAAAGRLSARSYVQDGLIFQLDGIENAGHGVHDAASATWKDLTGNTSLSVYGTGYSWGDNAFIVNGSSAKLQASRPDIHAALRDKNLTVEVVMSAKRLASGWTTVFKWGNGYIQGNDIFPWLNINLNTGELYWNRVMPWHSYGTIINTQVVSVAAAISNGETTFYKDGSTNGSGTCESMSASSVSTITLCVGNNQFMNGSIYAVRLHNRALTAAEIAANYAIDKARFNLQGGHKCIVIVAISRPCSRWSVPCSSEWRAAA